MIFEEKFPYKSAILYRFHASLIFAICQKMNVFSNASKAKYMTEEANEKKSYADSEAVGLTWNRDAGIECYQEEYLLKEWIKSKANSEEFEGSFRLVRTSVQF